MRGGIQTPELLDEAIQARGREIFARMRGSSPRFFSRSGLAGRVLNWSMEQEELKVRLFRLIDVLPALDDTRAVARHAREYLTGDGMPQILKLGLNAGRFAPGLLAFCARMGVRQMAGNFILASGADEAIPKLRGLRERGLAFTADILGEKVLSEREADQYQERYLSLIRELADAAKTWEQVDRLDRSGAGPVPKVNVSVKISALYSQILPGAPEDALDHLAGRLRPILSMARERGVFINFDMEYYGLKDLTIALFKRMLLEPAPPMGLALQAYLRESETDLAELIRWAAEHDRCFTVRLVKGAYWDTETLLARQRGWPAPVYQRKAESDASYETMAAMMLGHPEQIECAFGTHNVRSIAACMAHAEALGRGPGDYEFQMLYGMAEPIKAALIEMGHRVREYCPIGEVLPGMSYLVRRLLENTSNEGFLRAAFTREKEVEVLLRDPRRAQSAPGPNPRVPPEPPFRNEPHTDFTKADARAGMSAALARVHAGLGAYHPLLIGSREVRTADQDLSVNPAEPSEIVGVIAKGGVREADEAIMEARAALPAWSGLDAGKRAEVLDRTAELIRAERFELAALEVFEVGKTWAEADADVAEAIDFCSYYADEIRRIDSSIYPVPGELNIHRYAARGIAVIIAPWNFPLAILCGMTAAALVTGNCAIMKPSEYSPVIASRLAKLFRKAGAHAGALQFLPGPGKIVGEHLVEHPDTALVAFTGSKEVGLKIWEAAGRTVSGQKQLKKAICEMGGKNAIIVDTDADLDEAVPAILASAFGYQGQKCSAASRVIALAPVYERLIERLVEGASSLRIGLPEDPASTMGPVIDASALNRMKSTIEAARNYATLAFAGSAPACEGWFLGAVIFRDVPPDSPLAQEEIFGPVLAVMRAADLDEALKIANGTEFALTGGFFSRSPAQIERVKREFDVGNLYINRGITGALVGRHPFGGHRMSGGGTKAGGRDYLLNFMVPRAISENLMRRGFAGEE